MEKRETTAGESPATASNDGGDGERNRPQRGWFLRKKSFVEPTPDYEKRVALSGEKSQIDYALELREDGTYLIDVGMNDEWKATEIDHLVEMLSNDIENNHPGATETLLFIKWYQDKIVEHFFPIGE